MSAPASLVRAARRAGCEIVASVSVDGVPVSRVYANDAEHAAKLLAALAEEDAERQEIRALAQWIQTYANGRPKPFERAVHSPLAFARAVHRYVKQNVAFVRETGERFTRADLTLSHGIGDCDDHARAVMALLLAGGVPARLVTLHKGAKASHVVAQALVSGRWAWMETTVNAHFDEPPHLAAARTGAARADIANTPTFKVVEIPMTEPKVDPRTAPLPALLQRAGYLTKGATPSEAELRAVVRKFQSDANSNGWATLVADGLAGPVTRGALARVIHEGLGTVHVDTLEGAAGVPAGLTEDFFRALSDVCETLSIPVKTALLIMAHESGIKPTAGYDSGKNHASGLIQFVNLPAFGFGGTHTEFRKLSAAQQMNYVLTAWRGAAGMADPVTLLQYNFLPASLARGTASDDVVLMAAGGSGYDGREASFYAANVPSDSDRNGKITRGDLRRQLVATENSARFKEVYAYAQKYKPSTLLRVPPLVTVPLLIIGFAKALPLLAAKLGGGFFL